MKNYFNILLLALLAISCGENQVVQEEVKKAPILKTNAVLTRG